MMWGYHDGSGWWMVIGGVSMALFWIAIFAGIYYLGRTLGRRDSTPAVDGPLATEIALRRLASGEIDEAQYERIIARLSCVGSAVR